MEGGVILGLDVGLCGEDYTETDDDIVYHLVPKVFTESIVTLQKVESIDDLKEVTPEVDPQQFALINSKNISQSATKLMALEGGKPLKMVFRVKFGLNLSDETITRMVAQVSKVTLTLVRL